MWFVIWKQEYHIQPTRHTKDLDLTSMHQARPSYGYDDVLVKYISPQVLYWTEDKPIINLSRNNWQGQTGDSNESIPRTYFRLWSLEYWSTGVLEY